MSTLRQRGVCAAGGWGIRPGRVRGALILAGWSVLGAAILAGCNEPKKINNGHEVVAAPPGTLSVYQLAGRTGLSVMESTRNYAVLRNPANTVMVYSDPGGGAFVNGRPVGKGGRFPYVSGILFVPQELEEQLRPSLLPVQVVKSAGNGPLPGEPEQPAGPKVKGRVVVDPGHGGSKPGTTVAKSGPEKDINLAISQAVAGNLRERGVEVIMTRKDDGFVDNPDRAAISNRSAADLFVSIHANSAKDRSVHGFTVYTSRSPSSASVAAAKAIERHMSSAGISSLGVQCNDYIVLVQNSRPAVLVETGFLSNVAEAGRLADASHQARVAEAIAEGVLEYLQKK